MRIGIAILVGCALASCTTANLSRLADGGTGYEIACSAMIHTLDECYMRAAELCRGGYEILEQTRLQVVTFDPFEMSLSIRCR